MSSNLRIVAAFGLLLIAAIAGIFFSGQLILMLLKVAAPLSVDTYWSYVKALDLPQFAPYASKIKLAGAIGFGVPLLAWIALLIPLFKPKAAALHGDARFASGSDLAKKDMLKPSPTGIVVGKHGGKVVRLPGQQFVILAAPTRSGKGVGIVIPNLLDYQGSVVVLDIKQENFDLTSGWRKSQGQEVFCLTRSRKTGAPTVGTRSAISHRTRRFACRI